MELTKCKYRIRCEMGACGNRADFTLLPSRTGVRSCLHVCKQCLGAIAVLGGTALYSDTKEGA